MLQTKCWAAIAATVVSIGLPGVSAAATLHVPGDFATIQACIDAAVSGVDECVVAPGTYHETINFLGKAITVRSSGGADVTTIDATGIGGSVVTCASAEGPDTVLEGFTITGGRGSPLGGSTCGGGMYNDHSNPTVMGCMFRANAASAGGGMCNASSSPIVTACTFRGNSGGGGGGMGNYSASPTVTNCVFSENMSNAGGGIFNYFSSPTVTNCTFSGNSAYYYGAGMSNYFSSATVTNSTFSANTVTNGPGGAMYNENRSSGWVTNCKFIANTSMNEPGGGMYNSYYSSPMVANCMFIENTGDKGGGMYNTSNSNPLLTNCTFNGNTSNTSGGGMKNVYSSNPTVINCILWGDSPDEILNVFSSVPGIRFSNLQGGLPVGTVNGGGNIDFDPMFVRPPDPGPDGAWDGVDDDYGDLRLRAGSPCINTGDPNFVPLPGETDLDGHARVLCAGVDMGAYEFGIGDRNCNQTVNLNDFSVWSSCMTGPHSGPYEPGCEGFDFDGDGDVDLLDFGGFQRIFGP